MSGTWGNILRVDLSNSTITGEAIPEEWIRKFFGGRGLAARYLIEEVPKGADPLGPENELIFMAGLLTGVPTPTASKHIVVAKSPLTGIIGMSIAGGFWSAKLKRCGLDGVIFQGISSKPVYLVVDEGVAQLRDAGYLWGKNIYETNEAIQKELGKGFGVTSIGTAGENLVKYACIVDNDERAAGRCGLGAVMGSKRLKAIAVKGTKMVPIANKKALKESEKMHYALINAPTVKAGKEAYGTSMAVDVMNARGFLPHRNWQNSAVPYVDKINAGALKDRILVGTKSCVACPIRCERRVEVKTGKYAGLKCRGPEYETIGAWGGMAAIDSIEDVAVATSLCNDYGLDTISCGSTIAFAMECYEKGIITTAETEGLDMKFGNVDAALELIPKIARREGFGDLLAEGTRGMAKKLGRGTEKFAMNVKGLELPAYEARGAKILGLAYAVGSRGGCHNMAEVQFPSLIGMSCKLVEDSLIKNPLAADPEQVHVLKDMEDAYTVIDCSGSCKFVMGTASTYEESIRVVANVLGRGFTLEDFKKLGERVYNLERVFNVREGITRANDALPERLLEDTLSEGAAKGHVAEVDTLLDPYYEVRGWDKNGKPTVERLQELELDEIIKHLP